MIIEINKNGQVLLLDDDKKVITSGNLEECIITLTEQKDYTFTADGICNAAGEILKIKELSEKLKVVKNIIASAGKLMKKK